MPVLRVDDEGFLLDGQPFRILAGSLHYFRVHPAQWADRLRKARLMGLNTVDTYVPWNLHQPDPDTVRLDGGLDLRRFVDLAAAEGLHVLLRPGPYICAELEGGGLPSWLLAGPDIRLRSRDPRFLAAVEAWFGRLLPLVVDRLATRGGPVLAVQVENEYGAYGDDTGYLEHLVALLRGGGVDVQLFTCDQPADLARGGVDGVLRTVTFGSRPEEHLAALRAQQPTGPLMCSEFWNGWFDRWGGVHVVRDPADAAGCLDRLLSTGASVNCYMFHGGSNFGFTSGANDKHTYRPTVTSYDYDAPLDEAGDPTPKFRAFREVIARYAPVPDAPVPAPGPKLRLPGVELTGCAALLDQLPALATGGEPVAADRPLTMEELGQDVGFALYQTGLPAAGPVLLEVGAVRDRAQVFCDGQPVAVLERESHGHAAAFTVPRPGATLSLLVENQGRVNYGQAMHDRKGLLGGVTLGGAPLRGWRCWSLPLRSPEGPVYTEGCLPVGPALHRGVFTVDEPADTFLTPTGWTKGCAWVNGFHLGRYWARGPQRSLYLPAPVLRRGRNELVLLEQHAAPWRRTVDLCEAPTLGPTQD